MLLDLRSLEEMHILISAAGDIGRVISDSAWRRLPQLDKVEVDNRAAILALYAAGALTEDEFAAFFSAA